MPPNTPRSDLYGNVPDNADTALLIIDMINEFSFPGAEHMFPAALAAAQRIADLKRRIKNEGIPTIYVNDNFGRWRHDLKKLVSHCLRDHCRGKAIVELLRPEDEDYFVLKPKHSGFYGTPLNLVLTFLHVRRLIITGVAGNSCVLVTANDAYMRNFKLMVPPDCVVSLEQEDNDAALEQMRKMLKADVTLSTKMDVPGRR